ncbi:MAG: MFS transporter [Halieaceae bacterium]|nr:MFS transporter [Halieaceae bacterium]
MFMIFMQGKEDCNRMAEVNADFEVASVRAQLNARDMSLAQWEVVVLCTAINMLDGYDVLVMSFAAAPVAADWQLDPASLGLLLSAGLIGMAIGSIVLGSLADVLGRKRLVHICLITVTIGMILSAHAHSQLQLLALRFITGVGIGGMLATLTALVSEYSNDKRRGICMGLLQSGYPLGALLGGIIAAQIIQFADWRSLFLFGGGLSALLLPLIVIRLPESLDFVSKSGSPKVENVKGRLLERFGLSEPRQSMVEDLDQGVGSWRSCFTPSEVRINTLLLWTCYLALMFSFYFVVSWTPKLLVDAGLSTSEGISAGAILQAGGLIGALVIGLLGSRYAVHKLAAWFFSLSVVMILAYGWADAELTALMILSAMMGFFLIGAMIGLYTIGPALYDSKSRVTGVGLAIGVGRLGAIAAPFVGGLMVEADLEVSLIYAAFAAR